MQEAVALWPVSRARHGAAWGVHARRVERRGGYDGRVSGRVVRARLRRAEYQRHERKELAAALDPHSSLAHADGSFGPVWAFGPIEMQRRLDAPTGIDLQRTAVGARAMSVGEQRARRAEARASAGMRLEGADGEASVSWNSNALPASGSVGGVASAAAAAAHDADSAGTARHLEQQTAETELQGIMDEQEAEDGSSGADGVGARAGGVVKVGSSSQLSDGGEIDSKAANAVAQAAALRQKLLQDARAARDRNEAAEVAAAEARRARQEALRQKRLQAQGRASGATGSSAADGAQGGSGGKEGPIRGAVRLMLRAASQVLGQRAGTDGGQSGASGQDSG